jgi:hypothetical protein
MKTIQHISYIAIITIIMGVIYVAVQQNYRSGANDPQMQLAYHIKEQLKKGKSIDMYFQKDTIDLQKSLSIFVASYDENGSPLQSNAVIDGKLPQIPLSVIKFVKMHKEDWITWQPRQNIRLATGILSTGSTPVSYIAVGRSLKNAEDRISNLITMIGIGWTLCFLIILLNWLFDYYNYRKNLVHHSTV